MLLVAMALAGIALTLPVDGAKATTIVVGSTGDLAVIDGACTLREAITTSNANAQLPGALAGDCAAGQEGPAVRDVIQFSIPTGVQRIEPATPLPVISDQIEIDGRNGSTLDLPRIEIDGGSVVASGGAEHGLFLTTGSDGSYVHHLAVFDFPDDGFHSFTDANTIERVISGMDEAGVAASGNGRNGITIGGNSTTVERSVVSGNGVHGIAVEPTTLSSGTGTVIRSTRIGTTKVGGGAVPNGQDGINVRTNTAWMGGGPADDVTIGGLTDPTPGGACDGDCNLISGNAQSGIEVVVTGPEPERADGLAIEGNYVGTNLAGTAAVPNSAGDDEGAIKLAGAIDSAAIRGNLISGNGDEGVMLNAGASSDLGPTATSIAANVVGLAVGGVESLPNGGFGIKLDRSLIEGPPMTGTTIGGTVDPTPGGPCDGDCNVISGNEQSGISVFDTDAVGGPISATTIAGNHIGPDASGTLDRGNSGYGMQLSGVSGTTVGLPGAPNVISGNGTSGVLLLSDSATGNLIQSNLIGVAANGTAPLGNDKHGVETGIESVSQNTIGGIGAGLANTIAHNGEAGVMFAGGVEPVLDMPVLGNSIHSNGGLGIDLRPDFLSGGVTENGACEEAVVANRCQEFPVITAAVDEGSVAVAGSLASDPGKAFRIELFANAIPDPSGNGEGERFLGAVQATSDGGGNATWLFTDANGTIAAGEQVSATATELAGDGTPLSTSEFSDVLPAPTCHLGGDGGPNAIAGGGGGEVICGFAGNDALSGGGGRDAMLGGEGDDSIDAADGGADALIDCGAGNDVAISDSATVDPDSIHIGCEAIVRPPEPIFDPLGPELEVTKCAGKKATLVGTRGAETLKGTAKRDVIAALGGKDKIKGLAGNDLVCGGAGNDTLLGGSGKDKLYGGAGKDVLKGSSGKDLLKGEAARDTLNAGTGQGERCDGGAGRDAAKAPGCEKPQRL